MAAWLLCAGAHMKICCLRSMRAARRVGKKNLPCSIAQRCVSGGDGKARL